MKNDFHMADIAIIIRIGWKFGVASEKQMNF